MRNNLVGRSPSSLLYQSFFLLIAALVLSLSSTALSRPLTIDDVLAIQTVDGADVSKASADIAIAMPRPADVGEVYGRNAYEIDPSRTDIWLANRIGSDLRRLTNGKPASAGYWCPHWSPDGKRLAMLSTAPEGDEPTGGDNVRLYIWDRDTDALRRLSNRAMMTQVRYGSPLNELDLRPAGARTPNTCRTNDENAPFLWLDETRLLAMLMPESERSAVVDRYAKFHREAAKAGKEIRSGEIATVSRSDSLGDERAAYDAELVIFDLADGSHISLGRVPAFPMFGELTVALSPDGARVVVLAPNRAIPPHRVAQPRLNFGSWEIEKALFLVDLEGGTSLTSVVLPADARFPVDLVGWSPDSRRIALRARADTSRNVARLWAIDAQTRVTTELMPDAQVGGLYPQRGAGTYAFWAGDDQIFLQASQPGQEKRWHMVDTSTGEAAFYPGLEGVTDLTQLADGTLAGKSKQGLVRYDPTTQEFSTWQATASDPCEGISERSTSFIDGMTKHTLLTQFGPIEATVTLDPAARILDHDCTGMVVAEQSPEGSTVRFVTWDGTSALLMERNTHLADVVRGERRMIDYTHADGSAQKMAVLFPPDYDPAKPYPTLFWVYGGYSPQSANNFFFDPHMSGHYNLDLYAGQGYVVVVPSIPIPRGEEPSEPFEAISGGVLPALDELIALGITDESRVGVFGQSNGGYTVNVLVAQSDRFSAAASLAGASDLATNHASFDPSARGWRGIDQDMSASQGIYERLLGFKVDPGADPELYSRNSPLTYVDRINTPLLLIHGELDNRAPLTQPETLYSLLRRRGRTARLLRYWGESHSLANSPASVRDIHRELIDWFDRFVKQDD